MSALVIQQSRENPRVLELPGRSQSFVLESGHLEQLRALTAQYRHYIGNRYTSGLHEQLLPLGQALHTWLRDCGNWQHWLMEQDQPATLEWRLRSLQAPARQHGGYEAAEIAAMLCNTPWEILADAQGFLAKRGASRFVVLRRFPQTAQLPAPSDYRLSVLFMAASPHGQPELDYRAEEVAIEQAAGRIGVDLTVEESGELGQLGQTYAQTCAILGAVDVLHLSCHGHNQPQPLLMLENERGHADAVPAHRLWEHVGERTMRLGFISACHTAEGSANDPAAHYAAQLVALGLPAAVAWGGSVLDQQAIVFAEALYGHLSRGTSLEVAYRHARNRLADDGDSRDWHLPRLLLATGAEGALCSGSGRSRRSINPRAFADAAFLGGNRLVPIAAFHEFVGRRRTLQKAITALRQGQGVLLHGPGNLGKSSLAGRLARRFAEHHHVVLHCSTFTAAHVLQAIEEACQHPEVTAIARQTRDDIEHRSDNLRDGLARLLTTAEAVDKPLLLILDDFEHLLDEPAGAQGLHTVVGSYDATLRQILVVFAAHGGSSRLVITCRYDFRLSGAPETTPRCCNASSSNRSATRSTSANWDVYWPGTRSG